MSVLFHQVFIQKNYLKLQKRINRSTGLDRDEIALCSLAMTKSLSIIVCENTVVGHLSFGGQNNAMKDYFLSHPEKFTIPQNIEVEKNV